MTTNARSAAMWTMLAVIGACGLLGVVAIMAPSRFIDEDLLIAAFVTGLHALGAMVLIAIGRDQARLLLGSLVTLLGSMAIFLGLIFFSGSVHWEVERVLGKVGAALIATSVVLGHRMLVRPMLAHHGRAVGVRVVKRTALISTPIAAGLLIGMLFLDPYFNGDEIAVRIFGVALVISACSTLALGGMGLLMGKDDGADPGLLGSGVAIALTCPRCSTAVEARSGRERRCDGCRLRIRVEIDEPRCACGYLLYELESDTCPECGRAVPEEDRWSAARSEARTEDKP